MSFKSKTQKSVKTVDKNISPTGPNCISVKPPSYGMDVVDHGIVQSRFIQTNQDQQQATVYSAPSQVPQRMAGAEIQEPF